MIILYSFGPNMGLPDASPFCLKAAVLLEMSGLPFESPPHKGMSKAPKGADEPHPLSGKLQLSVVYMLLTFIVFAGYGIFGALIRSHVISRPGVLTSMRRIFAGAFVAPGAKLAAMDRQKYSADQPGVRAAASGLLCSQMTAVRNYQKSSG